MTTRFPCLNLQGGLIGADVVDQIAEGSAPGQKPADFGLDGRAHLTDEIAAAWTDARAYWTAFQHRLDRISPEDPATSITRDQWMIPLLSLLNYELSYTPKAAEVGGQTYALSHRAGTGEEALPVHIVGCRQSLDRRPPSGRPRLGPHSLLQEYLNRTEVLWGIVTNGLTLRVLRNSQLMRRQAYVEFDLRQMMEGEKFADFNLLYRLLHRTRLPSDGEDPAQCLLERYHRMTLEQGGRVRDRLRDGVEQALKILGNGFLRHPRNQNLRKAIIEGGLKPIELYQQLLRIIYRFLFLMVAEERNLITENPIYREYYSISRLRRLAETRNAYSDQEDLWLGLRTTFRIFQDERTGSMLGVPPLNGDLFDPTRTRDLENLVLQNRDLLRAVWHLSMYRESERIPWRRINYAALDVEELGSVYESLLDFTPMFRQEGGVLTFELGYGTERKSTGSYYTPPELVNELIKSALIPVMQDRLKEAKRMASGQWRTEEEKHYAYSIISRFRGLAAGHGFSGTSIQANNGIPQRGGLWPNITDSSGSYIDTSQHSRRMGASRESGISALPEDSPRKSQGTGNPFDSQPESGNLQHQPDSAFDPGDHNTGQADFKSYPQSQKPHVTKGEENHSPLTTHHSPFTTLWSKTPFATRYSLLAEKALLSLRVCDPAAGSGHFLLAAARTLGRELAKIRTGDDEPAPEQMRLAIRDCITHCIYGVDKNPLAVDLCKVALWIEGHAKGKPLTFLDHRIRCGDSLIGVMDLSVLKEGIPDDAFKPVLGDDKEVARAIKKRNKQERLSGQKRLPFEAGEEIQELVSDYRLLTELPDDTPEQVRRKAEIYQRIQSQGSKWWEDNTACHMWTAAFFVELTEKSVQESRVPTTDTLHRYLETRSAHGRLIGEVWALAIQHRFFHWSLEFPEVFLPNFREPIPNSEQPIETHHSPLATGRSPSSRHSPLTTGHSPSSHNSPLATGHWPFANTGFDVVLGNPPWERIKLQEKEFFAQRDPEIAKAPNAAARKRLISTLADKNPELWEEFLKAKRASECESLFMRASGRYPLCGRGDVNTYAVFAELNLLLINLRGRIGCILPTGIATDDTTKEFLKHTLRKRSLVSLFDFHNRRNLFPQVERNKRFCLVTLSSKPTTRFVLAAQLEEISPTEDSQLKVELTLEDIATINPNTLNLPMFGSAQDSEVIKYIYRRVPVLIDENKGEDGNPWGITFLRMFDMTNDSYLFRTREQLEQQGWHLRANIFVRNSTAYLPIYESKLIDQFNHRAATFDGIPEADRFRTHAGTNPVKPSELVDPNFVIIPRYWVMASQISVDPSINAKWFMGFRNAISAVADSRSLVGSVLPFAGVGNSMPIILSEGLAPIQRLYLLAMMNSFVVDYTLRQKDSGSNLNFYIFKQLPFMTPAHFSATCPWKHTTSIGQWISPYLLELTYTAWDLELYARDCGYYGPPFRWNEKRRRLIRCELDAAFFHLYLGREEEWQEKGSPKLLEYFPIPRDAVDYVMETFPIVKRRDEDKYGEYRTKRVILECYDAMAEAMRTGRPYQTILDPPPADPRLAHPPRDKE